MCTWKVKVESAPHSLQEFYLCCERKGRVQNKESDEHFNVWVQGGGHRKLQGVPKKRTFRMLLELSRAALGKVTLAKKLKSPSSSPSPPQLRLGELGLDSGNLSVT